ncbi:MAG: LTA synthase family protein [Oscillospiraceae bacterium]|nr:LTA synthase family protein [Oscillospiraceae bacterium]
MEMLSRRSIFGGLEAFAVHPIMFIYNSFIIFMTLGISTLFRKRIFVLTFVALVWLACGITNCVLLGFRTTPFSAVDLQILSSVMEIINVYLNNFELTLIVIAIITVVIGLVILFFKTPKTKGQMHYLKTCSILCVSMGTALIINNVAIAAESDSSNFPNIADAYEDYGFVYCFSNSLIDTGIDKPEEYTPEAMNYVAAEIGNDRGLHAPDVQPNVVMVQLESFFDVNLLNNKKFTENPVPNFTALKESCPTGLLTVPSIGAGTANTEFEILTGISLDFFGASEYPFKTVLKEVPCESIGYNLADYGYSAHAIHNNDGTFYDRHIVYSQLGFDTFTPIEYMHDVELNPKNWADDSVLVSCVTDALEYTDSRDFVFAVSVQPHGRYPSEMPEGAPHNIFLSEYEEELDEGGVTAFEYYINQLHETDAFIGELMAALEKFEEPTVLVLYGDHLPNLNITNEEVENGNILQTEYVIWSNYEKFPAEKKDLAAYQLSAHVTEMLGFGGGYISYYNRNFADTADYPAKMQDIGYDMLFGEQFTFGSYASTDMKIGVKDVVISDYYYCESPDGDFITVNGENFTEFSIVTLNGKRFETEFINRSTVRIEHKLEAGDEICVIQAEDEDDELGCSNVIIAK